MGDKLKERLKLRKDQLLILLLIGILLLVIVIPVSSENDGSEEQKPTTADGTEPGTEVDFAYIEYLEQHLAEILSQIDGAGSVNVMITLKSSTEKIVEKDQNQKTETVTESDSQGGTRTTSNLSHEESTVYEDDSDNTKEPYVSKTITPQIEGILVIATGGDQSVVKENMTEAVQALFDIDTHKIRIMKRKN